MCDTWVALSSATRSGHVIFAKNSDRPISDCQPLMFYSQQTWQPNSTLQLEYIEIPQVERTYAILGSSPYWCWGCEEGINEHRVVIGNEAIYTKTFREAAAAYRAGKGPALGLLGMDLVRLGLERSRTAEQAVDLMGALIEQYGQFGSGVPMRGHAEGGYDNSFMIADPNEVWILESAGCRWAARRVTESCCSISNQPSIRQHWDKGGADIQAYAIQQGWWQSKSQDQFDFARAYIDENISRQVSHIRAMRSRQLLVEGQGQITAQWMKRIARDHYEDTFLDGPYFDAAEPDLLSLCMHVSPAGFTWGNTASSCVAVLPKSEDTLPVFWWTPGPPCNGCYVPFFVHGSGLPEIVSKAGTAGKNVVPPPHATEDTFLPDSFWWLFRQLMDKVKGDPIHSLPGYYAARNQQVRERFDPLEADFEARLPQVISAAISGGEVNSQVLDEFTQQCVSRVVERLDELLKAFN